MKDIEKIVKLARNAMEDKKAALDCKDDYSWFDDDEVPADEPVEAE